MFDYQPLKDRFYRLYQDADGNVRKEKLKAPVAPPVYEGLHDHSLARKDVFGYLMMSHYKTKEDFLSDLDKQSAKPVQGSKAFDEVRYIESRKELLQRLIDEYK